MFSNLSSSHQYLLNDIKNFVKNDSLKSRNFPGEKKPTPSTNMPLFSLGKSEQVFFFFFKFVSILFQKKAEINF